LDPKPLKFFASASESDSEHPKHEYSTSAGLLTFTESGYQSKTKVYLEYTLGSSSLQHLSSTGIADPLLLAWELLPWSFVADWFLPVGNYLENLNYDLGLTFKKGRIVTFSKNRWTGDLAGESGESGGNTYVYSGGQVISSENIWLTREALSSAPRPAFPSFKNPFSTTHMWNAIALARGQFKK
jgi:hypothetical protein